MTTGTLNATAEKTVRELTLEIAGADRIFESLGIDYCCGGHRPLEQACKTAGAPVDKVLSLLDEARQQQPAPTTTDWQKAGLADLVAHIVETHHVFRLTDLFTKVVAAHGERHPELHELQSTFTALSDELHSHLGKEEQILFPYISQKEHGMQPHACFGTVENPIRMMMFEHDNAGEALRVMRKLSGDYTVPAGACLSYAKLYEALERLEADLHQHIHLENNILFPRAIAAE